MIIAFAFALIGTLLVLANSRRLRTLKFSLPAFILASGLAALGVYFMTSASRETNSRLFFPMFSPLAALTFLQFTRLFYKMKTKKEIIIYMHGLFPVRQYERHVTRQEKNITFILLLLSVAIPYMILILFK